MAPLPPSNTARLRIKYHVGGHDHVLQIRYAETATLDDAVAGFNELITSVGDQFLETTFVSATNAVLGSDIFNPVTAEWPVGWGGGTAQPYHTAWFLDFVGRSLDGRRVRLAIFGAKDVEQGGDYRVSSADNESIAGGVEVLNSTPGVFVSINQFAPVWYQYADMGVNAYWRNKVR